MDSNKSPTKVPEVTLGFWIIKVLATTLGETGGDAVTMNWLKAHVMDVLGAKVVQDQVLSYCEANPQKLVIDGIATALKVDRAILGIQQ